ncbi:hypothetical protein R4172_06900 [Rhodococcus kroppenstedtii]|uniref:Uncharacterized protein n=1 Tax=Rhodococcoides kroppenstedtii TaxID=293050 RepID=A0ABS7NWD6_9NOCA|nr:MULTISPECIES: hypothetical protein [Rhodococcus]AMY19330.1 hypothetical protein A3Q40_01951 [Rhodococcus sp. PBTS 1]MBY6314556.1 hypothetical protein [Rhodococcus kroppenstedtii]MBY6322363.1 hypothetical protein [Rhodococcus kroppenstedtii]MBY6401142.1 hypothetical protein [Rhodococcus kroppenstedtii]MBY6435306.1 hypothetical protein [Rhodococcus kroppenstedtii]
MAEWAKKIEEKTKEFVAEAEVNLAHLEGADAVDLDEAEDGDSADRTAADRTATGGEVTENDAPTTGSVSEDPDLRD